MGRSPLLSLVELFYSTDSGKTSYAAFFSSLLNGLAQEAVPGLNPVTHVYTQVTGEEGERPDLVGYDDEGIERVLIEAKFWAGLTENQPNAYLERSPDNSPSVLLFVAPEARLNTLWPELCRRIERTGIELAPDSKSPAV